MSSSPQPRRVRFCRPIRIIAIAAGVLLAVAGLWALFMPGNTWRYYSDGIAIHRPAHKSVVRRVVWEDPALVAGAFNQAADTYEPSISADGRRMIFTRGRARNNADLYSCTWNGKAWGDPVALDDLNTAADELGPALSHDGQLLYFYSDRDGSRGGYDIWIARWDGFTWVAPTNAGDAVNSVFNEYGPALAPGGDRLFFSSNRPRREMSDVERRAWKATLREVTFQSDYDIFAVTILPDEGSNTTALAALPHFGEGDRVAPLNSPQDEGQVVITPRGDFLYFSSNREDGQGGFDLYRSRLLHGRILPPENLGAPINTAANEMDPALRLEGFGLVFSSNREQADRLDYRLYTSTSRDVFVEYNLSRWNLLWWSLMRVKWWLLILLGALALLTYLVRNVTNPELRHRRSLLHTCLLVSALVHALLLFVLGFWIISTEVLKTLADPAMQVAVDLDALAREKISLDIREEVTTLPATADTLVVEQVERRMPSPELAPPGPATQPIVAQSVVQPLPFELPPEPQPVPRETVAMVTPDTIARLPELDLPPAMLEMDELPTPPAEPTPETPQLSDPQRTATAAEPSVSTPAPDSAPADVEPAPATELVRQSSVQSEAAPQAEQPDATLEAMAELRVQLPEVDDATALSMDERTEVKAAADEVIASLAAPDATTIQSAAAVPMPEGPVDRRIQSPQEISASAMVSPVTTSRVAEAEMSTVLSPADRLYTNLSTLQFAVEMELDMTRPLAVTGALPDIQLSAPERAAVKPDEALQGGRPEALDVAPAMAAAPAPQAADRVAPPPEEALLPATTVSVSTEQMAALPEMARLATPRLDATRTVRAAAAPARAELTNDRRRAAPTAAAGLAATPRAVHLEVAAVSAAALPQPEAMLRIAPADLPLPLPRLDGIGHAASSQLPSIEDANALRLETSQVASVPHYMLRRPENRGKILDTLGGDEESEESVQRSLSWLLAAQEADGHWDIAKHGGEQKHDVAATGLSLLCFFGWGATHTDAGPYQDATQRAIDWLLKQMKEGGDLRSKDMYDQGIATMALTEAYGLTKDEKLLEPARQAVAFILKAQHKETGGWRYGPGDPGDMSVFGWQFMALKSAQMAGLEVPAEALTRAEKWLDKVGGGKAQGLYGYQGRSPAPAMVAEGMFCRQLLGREPDHATMQESAAYLNTRAPDKKIDYYYLYYGTLALFQHQGPVWAEWNPRMKKALMKTQKSDGAQAGSWDPAGSHGSRMGRVVSTAMATLSLEVYYRYLPLYGLRPAPGPTPP